MNVSARSFISAGCRAVNELCIPYASIHIPSKQHFSCPCSPSSKNVILGLFCKGLPTGTLALELPRDNSEKPQICGSLGVPTRCLPIPICWMIE